MANNSRWRRAIRGVSAAKAATASSSGAQTGTSAPGASAAVPATTANRVSTRCDTSCNCPARLSRTASTCRVIRATATAAASGSGRVAAVCRNAPSAVARNSRSRAGSTIRANGR